MATTSCATLARHLLGPATASGNRTCAGASTSYCQQPAARRLQRRSGLPPLERRRRRQQLARGASPVLASAGEIVEVEDLRGIRVLKNEDGSPRVEYLVQWKDGSPDTWEVAQNLADNLLRDYEERWWGAVKKGDEETMVKMMEVGGDVLSRTVNAERRSALHFAAAMGKAPLVERLLRAGAEVDLADKEGYTPLHMAAGYMHTTTIAALLAGGADPEQEDRQQRSPLQLVEGLRAALPAGNPMVVQRRIALENVIQMLTANMFEDVDPAAVLEKRVVHPEAADGEAGEGKEGEAAAPPAGEPRTEWLVKFADEEEAVWVDEKYVSQEVVDDFEAGLEYAQAECILDMRQRGTMRKYLVRWQDDYPDTWEVEEHVSPDLIQLWERQQGGGAEGSDGNGTANGALGEAAAATSSGSSVAAPAMQLQSSPA